MDEDEWREPELNEENPDIASLLDEGYETLDEFGRWLEEQLELPERTVQRDMFNAEAYVDYLANTAHKAPAAANEYDLRWFIHSHYIRKSLAERETAERLLHSISNFYHFQASTTGLRPAPWVSAILEDSTYYLKRLQEYGALDQEDERAWEMGFRAWCDDLIDDLDSRCLAMPREISGGLTWNDVSQWKEAGLRDEANRIWQEERERLLAQGFSFDEMRPPLLEAYERWVHTPQEKLDDQSPLEVIYDERETMGLTEEDEEE
jgi:hypothetical protein